MKGVILAAGVGSRLRPITDKKPKCLVKTAGKPLLQYQLDAYKKAGIMEVFIVVGYEADAIIDYCKHIKDLKIHIVENVDYETTNNMYSFYLVSNMIRGSGFILNNADLSIDNTIIQRMIDSPLHDLIAVDTSIYNDESMKVSINEGGFISDISKGISEANSYGCSIDFYKFSKESAEIFSGEITRIVEQEKNLKDWTEVAMQRLFKAEKLKFKPLDISGIRWVEIDNFEDLAISDRRFSGFEEWYQGLKNFYFDLDGTVYVGGVPLDGAIEAIERIKGRGQRVYFLSNNSSKSKSQYVEKLRSIGLDCEASDLLLSTDSMVKFLRNEGVSNIFVLGTNGLIDDLQSHGFVVDERNPEYVVVGYDTELTYSKLTKACGLINAGVDYIATHCDKFCPSEHGPLPDAGALLEMLEVTTSRKVKRIFGKPMVDMVCHHIVESGAVPGECVMIGDRIHTDIHMAHSAGMRSILVLSGETSRDMIESMAKQPDLVLKSIADLV